MYVSTLGETPAEQEWSRLYQHLRGLSHSIAAERERGNVAGVQAMLPLFRSTRDKMARLNVDIARGELTTIDRFLIGTEAWVSQSLAALPKAIGAVPAAIGAGLIRAAVPFALLAGAFLYFKSKATRL